jgi:hypothetical protein
VAAPAHQLLSSATVPVGSHAQTIAFWRRDLGPAHELRNVVEGFLDAQTLLIGQQHVLLLSRTLEE